MAQPRKVIISCAITGSIHTPSMSPFLPITAAEISESAIGAAAGVSALGLQSLLNAFRDYQKDVENLIPAPVETLAGAVGEGMAGAKVELDRDDESAQSILLWYPSVTAESDGYIRKAVKIESGAKSALDPHARHSVVPYLADDLPGLDLTVANVTIVEAERTFWDKVVILHGLRRWFDARQVLRAGGQRVSRHYYDIHQLMIAGTGASAMANPELGRDCVAHARMFFNSRDLDLAHAEPGSFSMTPTDAMIADLRRDYGAMAGMIFGDVPDFDAVLATVETLQRSLNEPAA
ncbi:nucleotidyl transferase AbiEii/AbiGii toxin family protein [Sphingobium sp. 3R8]|uniref:nucleotidyl transferase AbiEii/AbiGii toxin family protein n=1 Tax=Sphingobium sp. 3R8 TaxID=2874921 RepID=UPI001CC8F349|nr:nucleotidyl transferase AbiEii/AbiGii toxin family protein [Sphingobium sp. 3R8]MBZ9646289.1 nucleotidyl transferase AbiEii/AbiGii toxin family protein [Sphingobium sp. 3R8]